jgi:hypothetical protein
MPNQHAFVSELLVAKRTFERFDIQMYILMLFHAFFTNKYPTACGTLRFPYLEMVDFDVPQQVVFSCILLVTIRIQAAV